MSVSITTAAVAELGRVLDARARAARTQFNTSSMEGSLTRLDDALTQAEAIMDFGEVPPGVDANIYRAFELSYQRAYDLNESLYSQAFGGDSIDTWSTFGIDEPTLSDRVSGGSIMDFGGVEDFRLGARTPTTSGEPDIVGSGKGGSALPSNTVGGAKGAAIETYRREQTNNASIFPIGIDFSNPLVLGGIAAAAVGFFFLVRR